MADESNIIGKIKSGAFETVGRTESWAEQRQMTTSIVGQFKDIVDKVKPGDSMAMHSGWFGGNLNGQYYVKNLEMASPDGITGELRLTYVKCGQGKTKPYNVTWDVSMEEVQMRLINHPMIQKHASIGTILKWEETRKGWRAKTVDGEFKFYYMDYATDGSSATLNEIKKSKSPWTYAYCKAVTQGIETYNRYLPVITKVSSYLEIPGAQYNQDHVITGGTISEFSGASEIGHFDAPELKVKGFQDGKDGVWYKNCDKFTTQADGSATRTEGWVFTNDPNHMWVYTNQLDD